MPADTVAPGEHRCPVEGGDLCYHVAGQGPVCLVMPLFLADFDGRRAEFQAFAREARAFVVRDPGATQAPFDVRARLGEIRAPTLILAGERDFICSVRWARLMEQGVAGAALVVFPRSGHMAHVEEPAAFAAAIAEFPRDRGGPGAGQRS